MRFTMEILKCGYFDGIENVSFEGIDLGDKWNGWACPAFTKEVADDIAAVTNKCSDELGCMEFFNDANGGCYVWYDGDGEIERFEAVIIDGNVCYPIGAYSWIWEVA